MRNKDSIDELFEDYFRDEISKPIPTGFTSRLMGRINVEMNTSTRTWFTDNLWIIMMSAILIAITAWYYLSGRYMIDMPEQKDLLKSFRSNQYLWYQMLAMLFAGLFIYYIRWIIARIPNGVADRY